MSTQESEKRPVRGKVDPGPTAATVAANVKRLRASQGLSLRELSTRLAEAGWPITVDGLNKIELNRRRVDSDDLMALAIALGVNPNALLLPCLKNGRTGYRLTGYPGEFVLSSAAWDWAKGQRPIEASRHSDLMRELLGDLLEDESAAKDIAERLTLDFLSRTSPQRMRMVTGDVVGAIDLPKWVQDQRDQAADDGDD